MSPATSGASISAGPTRMPSCEFIDGSADPENRYWGPWIGSAASSVRLPI